MRISLDNISSVKVETYFYVDFGDKSQESRKRTVSDGEIKYDNLDFFVFPGISICVPIVILNDKGEVLSAIHADPNWTADRLNNVIRKLIRRKGATRVEYAERINPTSVGEWAYLVQDDHHNRLAILNWLKGNLLNIPFYRTEIVAEGLIDHIGYKKKIGFKKIQFN